MSTFWWYQPSSGPLPQTWPAAPKGSEVAINPSAKTNPKGDALIVELHKAFHVK